MAAARKRAQMSAPLLGYASAAELLSAVLAAPRNAPLRKDPAADVVLVKDRRNAKRPYLILLRRAGTKDKAYVVIDENLTLMSADSLLDPIAGRQPLFLVLA